MKLKHTWIDSCLGNYDWYRQIRGGVWYQHVYTDDAIELKLNTHPFFWARYFQDDKNLTIVLFTETYTKQQEQ